MRTVTVVLVAVLVTLSGCSGLVPGGDGDGGDGGDGQGPGQTSPYAPGYAASGVTNATAAVEAHETTLLSQPGFTVEYNATVDSGEGTTNVDYSRLVETGSREVLTETNITSGSVSGDLVQYYHNGTVYQRSSSSVSGSVQYANKSGDYNLSSFTGTQMVEPVVSDVSYGSSEVITYEGDRAVRYSGATLDNSTRLLGRGVDPANVTDFKAAIVVDARGVVRHVRYNATTTGDGERTLDVTISFESGEVSVNRPSWVAKA